MSGLSQDLVQLYVPLVMFVGSGVLLGFKIPAAIPFYLGKALFWVGVPLSIFTFLRQADLSGSVWIAPMMAWMAMLLGASLAWLWIWGQKIRSPQALLSDPQQPSSPESHSTQTFNANSHRSISSLSSSTAASPPKTQGTNPELSSDQVSADRSPEYHPRLKHSSAPLPNEKPLNPQSVSDNDASAGDRQSPDSGQQAPPLAQHPWSKPTQGSFLISTMFGNTGYLGYPVTLAIVGPQYFAWAIFYDTLGSTLGAYGLGVVLAARFGMGKTHIKQLLLALVKNPALWGFVAGVSLHEVTFPTVVESGLRGFAWSTITLALLLLGMRLSQIRSWNGVRRASVGLTIKMLIIPLILGLLLSSIGLTGAPQLVIVLQMAMPPAFATLVIAEAYNLDRMFTVTSLAIGTTGFLFTLPLWLWLFGT